MTTNDILQDTEPFLIIEQKIKALMEPLIITAIRDANFTVKQQLGDNWHLISRGGDALNYYYGGEYFVPTHDWDLGLVSIPAINNIDQQLFDRLRDMCNTVGEEISRRINEFYLNNPQLYFTGNPLPGVTINSINYNHIRTRLGGVIYKYTFNGEVRENALVDIIVIGNVNQGVKGFPDSRGKRHQIWNTPHFDEKFNQISLRALDSMGVKADLKSRNTLFKNTFNIIVQDEKSDMKYVAPGDLLTDTMRMIYQSIYDINIAKGNNKLKKYVLKYSILLDRINKMIELCPDNSCIEVSATMISRNTSINDCNGNPIPNMKVFYTDVISRFSKFYNPDYMNNHDHWTLIPSQKLCEMLRILNF
jgi:hypothetical protein